MTTPTTTAITTTAMTTTGITTTPVTMESVQDVVQRYLGALGSRNLDELLALVAPAVEWDLPGNQNLAPWLGKRSDRTGVRASFELLWAAIEPISMTLQHMFFADQHCVITGELASRMRATGKVYESMFTARITVRDGLIVKYTVQEDSWALVVALTP